MEHLGGVGIGDPIVRSSRRFFDSTRGAGQWAPEPDSGVAAARYQPGSA